MTKANRVLLRELTVHSKHPFPKTQENTLHMDITRWSTPKSDWLYCLQPKMEKLYTVSKNKTRRWLAQIMNSLLPNSDLKKVGKNTRPFRYDLNKIPYWGGLTNSVKRREGKGKEETKWCTHWNAEFQRIARRDKKALLSNQCKEIEVITTQEVEKSHAWPSTAGDILITDINLT